MSEELTSRDAQAVFDRHDLHIGVVNTEVAAVILRLEHERDRAMAAIEDARERVREAEEIAARAEVDAERAEAAAESIWQEALTDAWKLIGRCDMAFELIANARGLSTAKQHARKLRDEIRQATAKGVVR